MESIAGSAVEIKLGPELMLQFVDHLNPIFDICSGVQSGENIVNEYMIDDRTSGTNLGNQFTETIT